MPTLTSRHTFLLVAIGVLLAGFAVRVALHDYHGLEGDDGFSLALARTPVETLIPGLMRLELDIHPPLHFLALKAWAGLTGENLLALRLMNILLDVLAGALLLRLAGRVFNRQTGLYAGLLWVAAPLLLYATYLLRMYTLEASLVAAGAVCTVEAVRTRKPVWSIALGAAALATLYTHITGIVATAAFALALAAAWAAYRDSRRALPGLVALLVAGVLYLPFASGVWAVFRSGRTLGAEINTSQFASPLDVPGTVMRVLLFHRLDVAGIALLALLALGSGVLAWRGGRRAWPLLALAWGGLLGMMLLAAGADLYKPRYLAPFVAPVLALIAGLLRLIPARGVRVGLLVALIAVGAAGIVADLDRATRDDFLAAARFVQAHERPGDAVIVIPDWGQEAFRFHYRGAAPVTGVFPHLSPDLEYEPILDSLVRDHSGVWLVRYQPEVSDPDDLAPEWFARRAATVTEVFPAGMRVIYYDFDPGLAELPPGARPLEARFGDVVALRGVDLPLIRGPARDARLHPPSAWVHVALYWEALQSGVNFVPRVRLTDASGQVYGAALERDNGVTARHPVDTWQPGEIWRVAYDLNINPQTPPGVYNIEVMVLDPATSQPLPAMGPDAGANWVIAGHYTVEP